MTGAIMAVKAIRAAAGLAVAAGLAGLAGCVLMVGPSTPTPTVGNQDWGALEVRDCVSDDLSTASEVPGRATMVRCGGGEARAQLVATTSKQAISRTAPASYDDESINKWCTDAFEAFIGVKASESSLVINWIKPADGTMSDLQCFAASREPFTRSLEGSGK